jgi:hypothetical protein
MPVIASVNYIPALLENRIYITGLIFHLYQVFIPPVQISSFVQVGATNQYKCPLTETRRGLIQLTRYKCLTFVPVGGSARYKCEDKTPTGINMRTFIPGLKNSDLLASPPSFLSSHSYLSNSILTSLLSSCASRRGAMPGWG